MIKGTGRGTGGGTGRGTGRGTAGGSERPDSSRQRSHGPSQPSGVPAAEQGKAELRLMETLWKLLNRIEESCRKNSRPGSGR